MSKVPKYVIELLRRRTRYAQKLRNASIAVDDYCRSIGLDEFHPLYDDACLCSDIRIFCEEGASELTTLSVIEKVLEEKRQKECPACVHFVGCETACGGRVCGEYKENNRRRDGQSD